MSSPSSWGEILNNWGTILFVPVMGALWAFGRWLRKLEMSVVSLKAKTERQDENHAACVANRRDAESKISSKIDDRFDKIDSKFDGLQADVQGLSGSVNRLIGRMERE